MANNEWCSIFKEVTVHVLAARCSDHKPLLAYFSEEQEERVSYQKEFKFEASWLMDEEYQTIIQDTWYNSTTKASTMPNRSDALEQAKVWKCGKDVKEENKGITSYAEK